MGERSVAALALAFAIVLAGAGALAACGSPGSGDDQPEVDSGAPDSPPGCERPSLDAPDLEAYLTDAVAALATAPRFTVTERNAARTYLTAQLVAQGWAPSVQAYANGSNVFAIAPATMPGSDARAVVLGAHFDTVQSSPGANDNASGTAVVLAVGRFLAATPCRTRDVHLVLFDQEELGLFGSRAYAATLQPANVLAVHTIDQVAWDADGDQRFELESPTPALDAEWKAAANVIGVPLTTVPTEGTDHEAFRARGFDAVGLTEEYVGGDTSPLRHEIGDTAASIAPYTDYLVLAAKLTTLVILGEVAP